jgi:hypothetical protein
MVDPRCLSYLIAIRENTSNDSFTLHQGNNRNNKQKKIKQQQPQEQELNSIHQNLYNRASVS